jgi:hypothetical protein
MSRNPLKNLQETDPKPSRKYSKTFKETTHFLQESIPKPSRNYFANNNSSLAFLLEKSILKKVKDEW